MALPAVVALFLLVSPAGAQGVQDERGIAEDLSNVPVEADRRREAAAPAPAEAGPNVGWTAVKVVVVLAGISVAIWGLHRLAVRARIPLVRETGVVRKIALEPIAPDRYIQVVEVAGKVMLLGVTPASITHIATLEGEAADEVRLAASRASAGEIAGRFAERLKALWGAEPPAAGTPADRVRAERERLRSSGL